VVAVAAVVDQADFGVGAFESAVGQALLDRGDDSLAVLAQGPGEFDDLGDAAAAGPAEPPGEVGSRVQGIGESVQVTQSFFELPAAVQDAALGLELTERLTLCVSQPGSTVFVGGD
jgi:hypothetical protein